MMSLPPPAGKGITSQTWAPARPTAAEIKPTASAAAEDVLRMVPSAAPLVAAGAAPQAREDRRAEADIPH